MFRNSWLLYGALPDGIPGVEIPLELLNRNVIAVKPFSKEKILLVVSEK